MKLLIKESDNKIIITNANYKQIVRNIAKPIIEKIFNDDPYMGYYDYTDLDDIIEEARREVAEAVRFEIICDSNDAKYSDEKITSNKYSITDENMIDKLLDGWGDIYFYAADLAEKYWRKNL
jgi:hypothetical protein